MEIRGCIEPKDFNDLKNGVTHSIVAFVYNLDYVRLFPEHGYIPVTLVVEEAENDT